MAKNKWTVGEEDILVQAIKANLNLNEAFRQASAQLNRSIDACKIHWYTKLSPKNNPSKTNTVFLTINSSKMIKNRKFGKGESHSMWLRILKLLRIIK